MRCEALSAVEPLSAIEAQGIGESGEDVETTFKITGDYIELIKLLKITGLCDSGGMAQVVTVNGQVSVDGTVERRKRCKIRPGQIVTFAGATVKVQ